jgi:hypothetical protein
VAVLPYVDPDRVVKLFPSLDHTVWDEKVEAIFESGKYDTLTVNELFSKLKLVELHYSMTTRQESLTDSHSLALVGGKGAKFNANVSPRMYSPPSLIFGQMRSLTGLERTSWLC